MRRVLDGLWRAKDDALRGCTCCALGTCRAVRGACRVVLGCRAAQAWTIGDVR